MIKFMKTKQESDTFLINHYSRKKATFLNGQRSSSVAWFSAVADRFLDTEGNCSMRVLVARCLLSLWHWLSSRVLLCHLCNGEMDHLLRCMSKKLASKPAIVPTMTSHVQLQPLTWISLPWYNWIKGLQPGFLTLFLFRTFTEPSRWHLCFTSEYCTCHPLSLLRVTPPVVWEKCSQLSAPFSWLYKKTQNTQVPLTLFAL